MCIYSGVFGKHLPPFLAPHAPFSTYRFSFAAGIGSHADKYSLCTLCLGETFPRATSAAIFFLTQKAPSHMSCFSLPSFQNIFLQALNCELRCGCKGVSSARLRLFTLTRLPSPRPPSEPRQFKEKLKESGKQLGFYDFIGPEEALLGRCWTVVGTRSVITPPKMATVCLFAEVSMS